LHLFYSRIIIIKNINMKKLKLIFASLALILCNSITAATYNIDPCTSDIVASAQALCNSSSSGDVIVFPSGFYACVGVITCTKFISMIGGGIGITVLYRPETASDANVTTWKDIIKYNVNSTATSNIVVTGITFRSKNPCLNSLVNIGGVDSVALDGLSLASDCGLEMIGVKDFLITKCSFENFGNAGLSITHDDSIVGGLVNKCRFLHNAKGKMALGLGYGVAVYGTNTKWLSAPRFGTSNFIFIEDNYFDFHKHSIAAGGCALYVFRHNTVVNNIAGSSTAAIDAHEGRGPGNGSNTYATRAVEVYRNYIHNTTFRNSTGNVANYTPISSVSCPGSFNIQQLTEACIKMRGSEALVHDNDIAGFRFGVAISVNNYCGNSCGSYPIAGQTGYLSGLRYGSGHSGVANGRDAGDMFLWNNTYTPYVPSSGSNTIFYNYNTDTTYVRHNREYHYLSPVGYTEYTYPNPLSSLYR